MTEFQTRSEEFDSSGENHLETTGRDSPSGEHVRMSKQSTEVTPKRRRRRFSAREKLRILAAADACAKQGEFGALLRREGLYSGQVASWRQLRDQGEFEALTDNKRGRKPITNPLTAKLAACEKRIEVLTKKLEKAQEIIDVQKKIAALLGNIITLPAHIEEK